MARKKDLTAVVVIPSNISREAKEFLKHEPGFSRSDYYRIIAVLYERAAAQPLETTDDGAWYCEACGSTDVDLISWVKPNENMRDAGSESPDDDTYCNTCRKHETAVHHDDDDKPLFCKCLVEEDGSRYDDTDTSQPKAMFPSMLDSGQTSCGGCGEPYTTVRPEVKE